MQASDCSVYICKYLLLISAKTPADFKTGSKFFFGFSVSVHEFQEQWSDQPDSIVENVGNWLTLLGRWSANNNEDWENNHRKI